MSERLAVVGDFRMLEPPEPADLILTDPPYNIGHDYGSVSDRLPQEDYIAMMEDFATWAFCRAAEDASLFVVHYPEFFFQHGQRVFVEHGGWRLRQLIRWCYPSNIGHSNSRWTRSSRDIVWFTKGEPPFDPKADPEPYRNPGDARVARRVAAGSNGRAPYDWWEIDLQKNVGRHYAGYANQLPLSLSRRIILAASKPGAVVADPFAGTGSVLRAALSLGRRAWGCDANPGAPSVSAPVLDTRGAP